MTQSDGALDEGARHFDAGEWFEAHEVWEGLWRATPRGPEREQLQALIQLAVSLEHHRRGNPRGAEGQYTKAVAHLAAAGAPTLPLDGFALAPLVRRCLDGLAPPPRVPRRG